MQTRSSFTYFTKEVRQKHVQRRRKRHNNKLCVIFGKLKFESIDPINLHALINSFNKNITIGGDN